MNKVAWRCGFCGCKEPGYLQCPRCKKRSLLQLKSTIFDISDEVYEILNCLSDDDDDDGKINIIEHNKEEIKRAMKSLAYLDEVITKYYEQAKLLLSPEVEIYPEE